MTTAKQIIEISLRYVGQITNFKNANQNDFNIGLQKLNQVLDLFRKQGVLVDSTPVKIQSLAEVVNYPDWAVPALEDATAMKCWGVFKRGKPVPQWLKDQTSKNLSDLFSLGGVEISSVYPSTMPQGLGNWHVYNRLFFPDCDPSIYRGAGHSALTNDSGAPLTVPGGHHE